MPPDHPESAVGDRVRLQHMPEAALKARRFAEGRSRRDLDSDDMLMHALLSTIAIIGEAAARVTDAGRARASALPWGQIVATRNVLVHVYWGVDKDRIWTTVTADVPVLIAALEVALTGWPLPSVNIEEDTNP